MPDRAIRKIEELALGREPFEIFMLAFAALAGLRGFTDSASSPLQLALPRWEGYVWSGVLLGGCLLALAGAYWKRRETGLVMERTGLLGVALASAGHAIFLILTAPSEATFSALLTAGFALACFAQVRRISKLVRLLIEHSQRMATSDES